MKKLFILIITLLPMSLMAQIKITFDAAEKDYAAVGVYDTWELSPFRTNVLKGNAQVIPNHLKDSQNGVVDETDNILGIQRSRFGSNTFGVRIDLKDVWKTNETAQYVHVLVHKPNNSKVLLVGLGKRNTEAFSDEPADVEQFWVESNYAMTANEWCDMVFPVKTVTGVEVHSLVVVPDLRSPHNDTEDFACYIDQIEINGSPTQRAGSQGGDYPVNFGKTQTYTRSDRHFNGITLTGTDGTNYNYTPATNDPIYNNVYKNSTDIIVWSVKPGGTYTPGVSFKGNSMHAYAYIDYDNDGQFTPQVGSNHGVADGSEAVSWSAYNESSSQEMYSSSGGYIGRGGNLTMPSFTIPASTAPGIYRMRYKVDWNCINPGGGDGSNNVNMQSIISNGGGIIDILLNVHADNVTLSVQARNGSVTTPDGTEINDRQIAFGTPYAVRMTPAVGFENESIAVQHGYNLDGAQYVHGNRQWQRTSYEASAFAADGTFTLPASLIDGTVNIFANFKSRDYILLDEASALSDEAKAAFGKVVNIRLQRSFNTSSFNTLVLPFGLSAAQLSLAFGEGTKVYEMESDNESHIAFKSVGETRANVPFLILTKSAETSFVFDDVSLVDASPVASGSSYDFSGNYGGRISIPSGAWFLNSNTFYRSVGKSSLSGYRAYFAPRDINAKPAAISLSVDGVPTGIEGIDADDSANADIYNISGQKMRSKHKADLPNGVYIEGGSKVIVK